MRGRRAALPVVFLTFLSACGDEEVITGNIVTPKERYIQQADAVCRDYADAALGAEAAYRDASEKERAKIRRKLAATGEKAQDKIEALPRPETEDQDLLPAIFRKMRKQLEALRDGQPVAAAGLHELASRYGFDVCGQG